jgi:hypothetical protein
MVAGVFGYLPASLVGDLGISPKPWPFDLVVIIRGRTGSDHISTLSLACVRVKSRKGKTFGKVFLVDCQVKVMGRHCALYLRFRCIVLRF